MKATWSQHTSPRHRQQACPLDGWRTSSLIGFCHVWENSCAAHGGGVRSHLGVKIHYSLPVLYSKGKVFELTSSFGCCCATWSGQKDPFSTIFHLLPWCQHHSFQTKWAKEILRPHIQEHTLPQCIGGEILSFCSPFPAYQNPRASHLPVFTCSVAAQEWQPGLFPPGWSSTTYR